MSSKSHSWGCTGSLRLQHTEALCRLLVPSTKQQLTVPLCFPAVSALQVHRAEGGFARPDANNQLTNQTENRCRPIGEVQLKRSRGSCRAAEETRREVTGLTAVRCRQHGPAAITAAPWDGLDFLNASVVFFHKKREKKLLGNSRQASLFLSHTMERRLLSESLVRLPQTVLAQPYRRFFFMQSNRNKSCSPHSTAEAADLCVCVAVPSTGLHQSGLGLQGAAPHWNHLPGPGVQQTQAEGCA